LNGFPGNGFNRLRKALGKSLGTVVRKNGFNRFLRESRKPFKRFSGQRFQPFAQGLGKTVGNGCSEERFQPFPSGQREPLIVIN